MNEKVNILLVDDQPQKLLSYEAILDGLGENLLKASSGREALDVLLKQEIAVILLDVNMPGMDGFETASVIREHPRFAKTPIIFVTAISTTDLDRMRGYQVGAVDYVFVPVIPEILKAKVSVFVELHRKTRELAALNRELEGRVAKRTAELQDREARLRTILESEPECVKCLAEDCVLLEMNPAGLAMIEADSIEQVVGRSVLGIVDEQYREAFRALTERVFRGERGTLEFSITSLKGNRRWLETHAGPFRDASGKVVSLISVTRDITQRKQADEALRESEERLRLALDAAHMGTFDWEVPTNRIIWSHWHEELWGYTPGEFPSTYETFSERVHPEDLPGMNAEIARCIAARDPFGREFRVVWPDGSVHWVQGRGEFTFAADGQTVRMRGVVMEITERKLAEEALRLEHERFNMIVESVPGGIVAFQMSPEGKVWYPFASDRFLEIAAIGREILARDATPFLKLIHADDFEPVMEAIVESARQLSPFRREFRIRHQLKGEVWLEVRSSPLRLPDGSILWYGITLDVTERKQTEQALHHSHQRLQVLSRKLIATQETERRHLARELHDEMGQVLTMISVNLKGVQEKLNGTLQPRLDESIGHVDRVIQQVRSISLDLRPAMLDDLGLAAALRWYAERQAERAGFKVELITESTAGDVPTEVRDACFRVAQEALTNVVRYGKARQVRVELYQREAEVELIVRDDGIGFDVAAARARAAQGKSLGLLGMQERVELLDGKFEIQSAPGRGTIIHARFPLPTASEAIV